jgi:predicted phosphodiesterase
MNRLALISDIHGNILALDAVLADIGRRDVDCIFDLGDVAQGSLHPAEVVARLREARVESIRGNADRILLDAQPAAGYEADYGLARRTMSPADLDWLARQPSFRQVGDIFLCHGTPDSDTTALLETLDAGGLRLAGETEITERIRGAGTATVVACGHTHFPRIVRLTNGRVCVNPGSVGLPAYEDDGSVPHVVETGSPHARYAVLERFDSGWHVQHIAVSYDWDAAADLAMQRGRADRAHWLRTGRARPRGIDE